VLAVENPGHRQELSEANDVQTPLDGRAHVMQSGSRRTLIRELFGHLVMGACLGAFLALSLLISDAQNVFQTIVNSSTPRFTIAVFVGAFALTFAIGATLTGLIFSLEDRP
jgi:hypothetical protein